MTFPTSDMRLRDVSFRFFTIGRDLHAALKRCTEGSEDCRFQPEILTCIRTGNSGHRAGFAQITRPAISLCFEQATFLLIAAAKIISIEVGAFSAGRCSHSFILDTGYVPTSLCVHADDIADLHELRAVHFESRFSFDLLRDTRRSIAADGSFGFHYF
jgi:hypothetical protein